MEKFSIKWQAPEYHHYERSNDWFWAVGIIAVSIIALSFIYNNGLFGILILISTLVLIFYVRREPSMVDYEINQRGVVIGKELNPYATLESFWVETREPQAKIIIKSKKAFLPFLIIPIHDDDADDIAHILKDMIEEKEIKEPASQKIMEYLGF